MCGITGFFAIDSSKIDIDRMIAFIGHRGTDESGKIIRDIFGLGHARLSIIDISGGKQPFCNERGSVIAIGNHEIYNFKELRRELQDKGYQFKTRSDTEVIVYAYEEWGMKCFCRFEGMFAIAIVDIPGRRCVLGRDHIGIKPLLYARHRGGYVFASEAKPILSLEGFKRELDKSAFHLFMNFRYVPNHDTLFEGIKKLPPGTYAVIDENGHMEMHQYYSIFDQFRPGKWKTEQDALYALESTFEESVERHMVSDVPVGLYLSGGIDSSTVAAFVSRRHSSIQSFCMTFGEPSDEGKDAQLVADHLGLHHRNLYVGDAPLSMMPEVIWHVEEPKVNCLQGYLLAKEVKKYVKVVLGGMGGDELFAGYDNNDILYPMTKLTRNVQLPPPVALHKVISSLQRKANDISLDHYFRIADLAVNLFNPVMFYSTLRNTFDHNDTLMGEIYANPMDEWRYASYKALSPLYHRGQKDVLGELLVLEMYTKMVNDFLLTEDRVSMANGLEVRVPFLDKEFLNLSLSIPTKWKYGFRNKKKILKDMGRNLLPPDTYRKKKWGFSFDPYYQFSKDLRRIAEHELTRERVESLGLFNYKWIRKVLDHPPLPRMRWHYFTLWVMVGFSLWHRIFIEELAQVRPGPLQVTNER